MKDENDLIERLCNSMAAEAEAAEERRTCLSTTRVWQALLDTEPWTAAELEHLKSCVRCRRHQKRVQKAIDAKRRTADVWRVAASSVEQEEGLYTAVRKAAAAGSTTLEIHLDNGERVPLFTIRADEKTVEPCYVAGRKLLIDHPRLGQHEVTSYGGIILQWEDLKTMSVTVLEDGAIIEVHG
jgi:hypothetical protein